MFSQTLEHGMGIEMKYNKQEEGQRGVSMESSKAGTKERSPDGLALPNQNIIFINIMWYSFTRHGKKNKDIKLTKTKRT